jgi:hypothetical protein
LDTAANHGGYERVDIQTVDDLVVDEDSSLPRNAAFREHVGVIPGKNSSIEGVSPALFGSRSAVVRGSGRRGSLSRLAPDFFWLPFGSSFDASRSSLPSRGKTFERQASIRNRDCGACAQVASRDCDDLLDDLCDTI